MKYIKTIMFIQIDKNIICYVYNVANRDFVWGDLAKTEQKLDPSRQTDVRIFPGSWLAEDGFLGIP